MIFGTGIDIADARRFEKWIDDEAFCSRYFSSDELDYIRSRGRGAVHSLAAGFAAKEALGKALGTGLAGLSLKGISVIRNEKGKPYFRFSESVESKVELCGANPVVHLSLSHESDWAVAQVIIEVDND